MIYEAFILLPLSLIAPELGRGKVRGPLLMYSTNIKSSRPLDRIPIVLSNLEPGGPSHGLERMGWSPMKGNIPHTDHRIIPKNTKGLWK
jgi:hypothetical protein